jgi:hypothetical protein
MASMSDALHKLIKRRYSYRAIFLDETGRLKFTAAPAMADLKRFCYADKPTVLVSPKTGAIDPLAMAHAEGRREVWLRIQHYLQLDEDQLLKLKEEPHDHI